MVPYIALIDFGERAGDRPPGLAQVPRDRRPPSGSFTSSGEPFVGGHEKCTEMITKSAQVSGSANHSTASSELLLVHVGAHPVAGAADVEDGGGVEQPVGEDLVPVAEAAIGGEDDRAPVVAAADHLEDPVCGGLVEG